MRKGQKKQLHPTNTRLWPVITLSMLIVAVFMGQALKLDELESGEVLSISTFGKFLGLKASPEKRDALNFKYSRFSTYVKTKEGDFSIYVFDVTNNYHFSLNGDKEVYAASLYKLPVAVGLMKYIQDKKINWGDEIVYQRSDFTSGTGVLSTYEYGTKVTYRQLIEYLLKDSDNIAQNILLRVLPAEYVEDAFINSQLVGEYSLEFKKFYDNNFMTSRLYSFYIYNLVSGEYISKENKHILLRILSETAFDDRIYPALKEGGYSFAHKIGSWPGSWHDCGVVYGKDTLIVCLMSENASYNDVLDVSRELGKTIAN